MEKLTLQEKLKALEAIKKEIDILKKSLTKEQRIFSTSLQN